jgi:hypothetical protein
VTPLLYLNIRELKLLWKEALLLFRHTIQVQLLTRNSLHVNYEGNVVEREQNVLLLIQFQALFQKLEAYNLELRSIIDQSQGSKNKGVNPSVITNQIDEYKTFSIFLVRY